MKIAITGTRGIPNQYGGFEQNAENLGPRFVAAGHETIVFSTDYHPYQRPEWQGVQLEHLSNPERRIGALGTILYDRACVKRAAELEVDVVLALGYTPASLFFPHLQQHGIPIVTNMDGLEWRRSKWGPAAKRFIRWNERLAVERSDALIADNPGIQEYLRETYGVESTYIGYGADHIAESSDGALRRLGLDVGGYDLVVARIEPENNVDMIVEGHVRARTGFPLVVVGGLGTPLAKRLVREYGSREDVRLVGPIYNEPELNGLRKHSRIYLHGHTVGGTNPSLLEAMAAGANVWIHENRFNRYVVGHEIRGFSSSRDLASKLAEPSAGEFSKHEQDAIRRQLQDFQWERVATAYLASLRMTLA